MRKQLLSVMAFCAAGLVIGAQAQSSSSDPSSSSSSPGTSSSSPSSSYGQSSSQSGWSGRHHMGQQKELQTSQLTGAQVTGSSGQQIGTISDIIVNPNAGRLDFAVISVSGAGSSGSIGSTTSSTSSTSSTGATSTTGSKQVAVPWMLLRSSSMGGAGQSTSVGQTSFVFNGDTSKLQSAPNFDATTDLSQPSWRQSVFSYFGLSGTGSATGGAESPGSSSSSGTSSGSSSSSSDTGSSSSTTPHR